MHLYYSFYDSWSVLKNRYYQLIFLFFYIFTCEREKSAYEDFLQHPIKDIERILLAYVHRIVLRPLIVAGCVGTKKKREPFDLKCWVIYLRADNDLLYQLETFVHEILHIKLHEFGVNWHPNEQRLDKIAVEVAHKHRKSIKKLLFAFPPQHEQRKFSLARS